MDVKLKNLILIGFMGTGKTIVAKALAQELQWNFIDCDQKIIKKTDLEISEIFDQEGEIFFRKLEASVLAEILQERDQIIATGGGIVCQERARQLLLAAQADHNLIIWLQASPKVILKRTQGSQKRPLLNVAEPLQEIEKLLKIRQQWYADLANFSVDTSDLTVGQVVAKILNLLSCGGKH